MPVNSLKLLSEILSQKFEIVRDTDPRCIELEASGYTIVGESWGARLRLNENDDLGVCWQAIDVAKERGMDIQELEPKYADALLQLELANNSDYPYTPATSREVPTSEAIRALWHPENRIFGAIREGVLVGAISTSHKDKIVELDFASILSHFRGIGVGKALVASAIIAWERLGIRIFATGGASINKASLGTVESLGFIVEERWRSYQPLI